MNVTIYPESYDWLFSKRSGPCCLWSFGRHRPPVEIGDDLVFRDNGVPAGRAVCRATYKPGELNVPMHDGSRELKGWKVLWYRSDFEDLRPLKLNPCFGTPPTDRQQAVLEQHDEQGWLTCGAGGSGAIKGLISRGLVEHDGRARLTVEGLRHLTREMNPQRIEDLRHDGVWDASSVCRVCGCTENSACVGDDGQSTCSWVDRYTPPLCSHCDARLAPMCVLFPEEIPA